MYSAYKPPEPPPSPESTAASAPETPAITPSSKKKLYIIAGVVLICLVLAVVAVYISFLGARVAPGLTFRILGPRLLIQGQSATITWDTSPENAKQYPYEKIEYCTGQLIKQKCYVLASAAKNNGKAVIKVPTSLPAGKGKLKFTARNPQRKLFGSMSVSGRSTVTVKSAEVASVDKGDGGGGSDGGGGGGGGDSGGGGSGGSSSESQSASALSLPIIVSSAHENSSGTQMLISYYSASTTGYGLKFRQQGESSWRSATVGVSSSPHSILATINIGSELTRGKPIEFFLFAENPDANNPRKTYRVEVCPNNLFCSTSFPPLNTDPLSTDVTVSSFRSENKDGSVDVSFTTNKLVFLPQLRLQFRLGGANTWITLGAEILSNHPSFYTQSTSHVVRLSPVTHIDRSGALYEFRVTDKEGRQIGEIFSFTSPGETKLRFESLGGTAAPVPQAMMNGMLIRWETNTSATTEITTKSMPGVTYPEPAFSFTEPVVSHILPIVGTFTGFLEYDVKSSKPATGETITYHDVGRSPSTFCGNIISVGRPTSLASTMKCVARGGIGPSEGLTDSSVAINTPWVIYCSGQKTDAGRQCTVCQFPAGNFGAASCNPAPGDQAQW